MALVTITIEDRPDGTIAVTWRGVPCPVHEKAIVECTAAEVYALDLCAAAKQVDELMATVDGYRLRPHHRHKP